jgi:nuclear transcription Y subunit beta
MEPVAAPKLSATGPVRSKSKRAVGGVGAVGVGSSGTRKSAGGASGGDGGAARDGDGGDRGDDDAAREQDRFLPVANMSRIMRRVLPPGGKVAKEAKDAVQEAVSEFISFITSEASDKCMTEKRKTINGDDVLWAMGTLGFADYVEPLRLYLSRYRDTRGDVAMAVEVAQPTKASHSKGGRK